MKQTKAILIALFLGLVVGLTLNLAAPSIFEPLNQFVFNPIGQLFIRLIKMLVVPVVFISIVLGAAGLGDPKQLGRIGLKSISFFLVTTAVAISIAVTFALIIKPGAGGNFKTEGLKYEGAKTETSFVDTLLNIVPDNPAKAISSFVQPLGATINMDGTAIMQGVATVFIAQVYGVELTLPQLAMVVLTAVLASIGTAGVPGVGLVMLTMVLNQVNLPVEGIALIIGIDRILDMSRTAVNISGDAICAMIVAKSEEKYNTDQSAAS
ncbi:dicarboxylate/amino acid:cation symporter [Bacillus cereus group sp. MYBK57-1]|uniref:dicarboxylate/amino acid:cation symporter n=1 Tax=Bacillus cereus group sp. MYBK57-1 TaxID=3450619 RepID=UPI003F7B006E